MTPPLEPPPGCVAMPDFCVEVRHPAYSIWLTRRGTWSDRRELRGIWPTAELADAARERACEGLEE